MTAPPKPWESALRNSDNSFIMENGIQPVIGPSARAPQRAVPPSLPPRNRAAHPIGVHPRQYSPGGYGYGGYGGGYGMYGGYMPYGHRNIEFENRFVQMAEESAGPAFETIDNFVRGFSSVTMMLESTFTAMQMSFRAILGVAENMSRMKSAIFEFISAFAILKTIYTFYRKILYFLGLVNGAELTWKEAEAVVAGKAAKTPPRRHWPMLAFLTAIVAGPTLVYKYLIPSSIPEDEDLEVIGMYDFDAEQRGELSFRKGELMTIKKSGLKNRWITARKGSSSGLVPYNRIAVLKRKTSSGQPNPPTAQPNPPTAQANNLSKTEAASEQSLRKLSKVPPVRDISEIQIKEPVPSTSRFIPQIQPLQATAAKRSSVHQTTSNVADNAFVREFSEMLSRGTQPSPSRSNNQSAGTCATMSSSEFVVENDQRTSNVANDTTPHADASAGTRSSPSIVDNVQTTIDQPNGHFVEKFSDTQSQANKDPLVDTPAVISFSESVVDGPETTASIPNCQPTAPLSLLQTLQKPSESTSETDTPTESPSSGN